MRLFGKGLLLTFTEVPAPDDADFNEWYNREHLDERINLPGFRRARRYEAIDAGIRYLSTYEALEPNAIASPAYLEVLRNQTAWSRAVMGKFNKWHRMTCRVVADETHGMGAYLALVRVFPKPETAEGLESWLSTEALPSIARKPGVVGASAAIVDREIDDRLSRGLGQKPGGAVLPEWAILVEGTLLAATLEAAKTHLADRLGSVAAPSTSPVFETYHMLFANMRLSDAELA